MIEIVESFIRENYRKLGLKGEPAKISFVKMGGRQDRFSSVPFACFLDDGDRPAFYIKFPRDPASYRQLKAEFENLRAIRDKAKSKTIRDSVPVPIWYNKNPIFTVQSAVSGRPMLSEMTKKNFLRLAAAALSWLSEFHGETEICRVLYREYAREKIRGMIREIGTCSKSAAQVFSRALATERVSKAIEMPLAYIHGDFNPHNIMISGEKLGVFDWEESLVGLPLIDIFHLLTVSSFSVEFSWRDRRLSEEERYREHFLENIETIVSLIRNNYGLALDEETFAHAYVFYLAHMAVNEIKRDSLVNNFELWVNLTKMFLSVGCHQ
jgi:aminoglycoside phosphotransferase (APT) family kinase protein